MTTTIISNGSKWAGEQPDDLDTLLRVLETHTLDSRFGTFVDSQHVPGKVYFFGNFIDVSHVFSIESDEPETIEKLTAAIEANRKTPAYLEQIERKAEAEHKAEADVAARPRYVMGGEPRKTWDQLSEAVKDTWKRNPTPRQYASEPTEQGNQLVIPGCERDRSRGPVQGDLF